MRRFALSVLSLLVLASAARADQPVDTILYNGKIFTVDAGQPWAQAVAIRGSRIVAVGEDGPVDAVDDSTLYTILPALDPGAIRAEALAQAPERVEMNTRSAFDLSASSEAMSTALLPIPTMSTRFRPMPARQRRSRISRISSRDEYVSVTVSTDAFYADACG